MRGNTQTQDDEWGVRPSYQIEQQIAALQQELAAAKVDEGATAAIDAACDEPVASVEQDLVEDGVVDDGLVDDGVVDDGVVDDGVVDDGVVDDGVVDDGVVDDGVVDDGVVDDGVVDDGVVDDAADAAMHDVAADAANVPLPEGDEADDDLQIMVNASMCYSTCPSVDVPKLRSGPAK